MPTAARLVSSALLFGCTAVALTAQCQPFGLPAGPRAGADGPVHALGHWDPDGAGPLPEQLLIAGAFREVGTVRTQLAMFDEATGALTALAACDGPILCFATDGNGDLLVGGAFTSIAGIPTGSLARYDGVAWHGLGAVLGNQLPSSGEIRTILPRANGDLVVGGSFRTIGGVTAWSIAERRFGAWHSLGDVELLYGAGDVRRVLEAPNGDLIVAGFFASVAGLPIASIARFDGAAWSAIGPPLPTAILLRDALLHQSGDLYVCGIFTSIGNTAANFAARWNGSAWQPLPGLTAMATRLGLDGSGQVVVASNTSFGGVPSPLAAWNGTTWSPVGEGQLEQPPDDFTTLGNGDLVVGGWFATVEVPSLASRIGAGGLAVLDGASWRPLVAGTDGVVHDVVAGPADTHHVAGNFRSFVAQPANGVGTIRTASFWYAPPFTSSQRAWRRIARRGDGALFLTAEKFTSQRTIHMLQGSVLTQLGEAAGEACLAIDDLGELIVGAIEVDSAFPLPTPLARRSNATGAWWPVDVGLTGRVTALAVLADGRLAVGGDNLASTTGPLGSLAVYDGAGWDDLLGGVDAPPTDLAALPGGGLVAVGPFTTAGGLTVNGIASWDGSGWQAHGTGFAVPTEAPRTVAVLPTAELLVGGTFASAGGTPAANLARWDGASWHAVGSGTDGPVRRIDASTGGDVVLCGDFLSFDGATAAGVAAMTPSCPATTAPQLAACGAGVPPQVEVDGLPWRNGTARLSAAPFVGPSFAVGVFGLQPAAIPLTSLGLPSQAQCMLSVQPDLLLLAAPQQGVAHFALAIPGQPAVIGTTLYHQTVGFSFATPAAFTTSTSRRLRLVVGSLW